MKPTQVTGALLPPAEPERTCNTGGGLEADSHQRLNVVLWCWDNVFSWSLLKSKLFGKIIHLKHLDSGEPRLMSHFTRLLRRPPGKNLWRIPPVTLPLFFIYCPHACQISISPLPPPSLPRGDRRVYSSTRSPPAEGGGAPRHSG